MRLNGKSYSVWAAVRREPFSILVALVACAIGVAIIGAVFVSVGEFPIMQAGVPPISPRTIVQDVTASSQPTNSAQHSAMVESPLPSPAPSMVSGREEPVTHSQAKQQRAEVRQQRHRQQPGRELHRQARFSNPSWRVTRFNSQRDELVSGPR
jgi:hypothetical protein